MEEEKPSLKNGYRWTFYGMGILVLAMGLILNTKAGLGVSAIISVPYCISLIWNLNFGNTTLVVYCIFVGMEFLLRGKRARLYDLFQIPFSIVFTRFMNLFSAVIPDADNIPAQIILLTLGIILTGIGAAVTVNMQLVPNPGDGIVQAFSEKSDRDIGLTKNIFDSVSLAISIALGLTIKGKIIGVGIGTICAVFGVGRVIALFNRLFKAKMAALSGLSFSRTV